MNKDRLEIFTDGVFAIVATLLVLDIQLPEGTTAASLSDNLVHVLPSLATYILSFTIIGLYWIFHHSASRMFKDVDYRIVWLNILLIMFIGLIPFVTSLLSEFPTSSWAVAVYGIDILAVNLAGWSVMMYLYHHQSLAKAEFTHAMFISQRNQYIKIAALYAVAVALAFIMPRLSIFVYGFITLYLIFGTLFPQFTWRRNFSS